MNRIKNIGGLLLASLFAFSGVNAQESDPYIITIDGEGIKKSEFEYIYNKNSQQQIEYKTLDEYLKMFIDYKLKVKEAEACGIDTTSTFVSELEGYRNQLAQPYLVDQEVDELLAKEAYNRLQENVEVAHLLIKVDENATEKVKNAAYTKALEIKKRIEAGESFEKMAKEYSEDPSAVQNNGYLGYIKGFMTVFPFEDAAYSTEVGKIAGPVLSRFGYHLINVISRRQDPGEVLPAHIMVMIPTGATSDELKAKENKIYEAYQKLESGVSFEDVAEEYSEDPGTRNAGGKMRWISTGRTVPEFEKAAYSTEVGAYSKPFKTKFGWHIVKVIEKRGLPAYEDLRKEIMRRMARDERAESGRRALIEKLKKEYSYNFNGNKMQQLKELAVATGLDSTFVATMSQDNDMLFSIDGNNYSVADFATYFVAAKKADLSNPSEDLTALVNDYTNSSMLEYENSKLYDKYPDFRNLINEYRDGMLLFEISNREVWDKAAQDEKGLKKYFKKNRRNYKWSEPRFKGVVVQCKNDSVAAKAEKMLKGLEFEDYAKILNKEMNTGEVRVVRAKKGLFEKGDNNIVDYYVFGVGEKPADNELPISFTHGKVLKKAPESYLDIKGVVTADYQTELERLWIEKLNKKYNVEIDYDVVSSVKQNQF